ncbi:hypothetical protein EC973_006044 [Apophysomyces ossiformis]|uniref:BHLH domain-containing protein n=1 Tax=Apophysomyces ossiformis TaxID=679940 RepID=A0A8H7BR45_9FUNG|nr:hypothetical protein EC973_006044 [Apophysomyces ossiformis]
MTIQSKADRRAEHNAIERARRESLNTKFQQLAHSLPNLQNDSRPSKSTIIERTLEFVKQALQREERYKHDIRDLRQVNRQLLKQLSNVTNCHHQPPPSTSTATTTTTTATSSPMYCSPVNTAIMMTTSTAPTIASATFVPPAVQQDPTWEQFDSLNDSSLFSQSPGPTSSSPCEDSEDEVDDLEGQLPPHPTMGQFQVKCEPAIYN